jgi:response regulator RpfG family c-di-GMP phosphodiesterase
MLEQILFVDDEKFILSLAERIFQDRGFNILTCINPHDALECVKNNEIAILVSDNMMPTMTGIELLSRVRAISPDTVSILMTGYANLQTALDAINKAEAFRFIVKPWDNQSLIEMVDDAMKRYKLKKSIRTGDEATMLSLIHALELRDPYTKGHSDRVAEYSIIIAQALDIQPENLNAIRYGGWLHDCGKIGISENILHGEGPLDEAQLHIIKNHPLWGVDIVKDAHLSDVTVNIIRYHHERFDGNGYPFGSKADEIPLEARIVAVADVYDALTTKRSYRDAYSKGTSLEILSSMRANVLDPEIVNIFISLFDESFTLRTVSILENQTL